ncbi:IclR family transcriptional regulator [Microbispora siamensis]|uniref:IclR family transcriptional regulator n=1 Tax=Microbispora siamensis TaxID=564413 RepID=A0ABQ4GDD5_9ACTN|nr:IclR family transcriptional regulator [Microbispora siamensis]GIH59398.1 IclR family transcriptional regulator [Microbispora siamensis]
MSASSDHLGGKTPSTLSTLARGLAVFALVAEHGGELTARDISERAGLSLGTTYHLLRTLIADDYLIRRPGGRYDVGTRAAVLSWHVQRRAGPEPELSIILKGLHSRTKETAYVSGWRRGELTLLHYLAGPQAITVGRLEVGFRQSLHARASAKAVLAHLPKEHCAEIVDRLPFEPLTPNTITDPEAFHVELGRVRRLGYALDDEEFARGIKCVAAVFSGRDGLPAGAFTISVPAERFAGNEQMFIREVILAAQTAGTLLREGRLTLPPDSAPDFKYSKTRR